MHDACDSINADMIHKRFGDGDWRVRISLHDQLPQADAKRVDVRRRRARPAHEHLGCCGRTDAQGELHGSHGHAVNDMQSRTCTAALRQS